MKDKNNKTIRVDDTVKTIDYCGEGVVVEIHEDEDKITTKIADGNLVKSSAGVEKFGWAVIV
jgi:hypothetical protein